ncbi:MAG: RNA-binding S4 domain-containing protein [Bacilli bacterium]
MEKIHLNKEYITLGQLLKLSGFISNGSEAKFAVKKLDIKVNNQIENRRGKKLYADDLVIIEGKEFQIL